MLSLNLVVRAVIVHEGKLLLTLLNDGRRAPFYTLLGGHLDLGESLTQCVVREVREEVGIEVVPSRLLYVVENWFHRGNSKLHEIGFYFLCHPARAIEGDLLGELTVAQEELISPELHAPEALAGLEFQPAELAKALAHDVTAGFADNPRLLAINELPGDARAVSGAFRI